MTTDIIARLRSVVGVVKLEPRAMDALKDRAIRLYRQNGWLNGKPPTNTHSVIELMAALGAEVASALIPVEPVPTPREAELEAALPGAFITCNSEAPKYYVTIKTQTLADAQAWHRAVLARARIGRGS